MSGSTARDEGVVGPALKRESCHLQLRVSTNVVAAYYVWGTLTAPAEISSATNSIVKALGSLTTLNHLRSHNIALLPPANFLRARRLGAQLTKMADVPVQTLHRDPQLLYVHLPPLMEKPVSSRY